MQEIYVDNLRRIILNKPVLEKNLNITIKNRGRLIFIEGDAESEYTALKVIEALDFNFNIDEALLLTNPDNEFSFINIKDVTKRNDLERVRARIIGTHGKAINTLEHLTTCNISLKDNKVGIIGNCLEIEDAILAVTRLIKGSKHGNVYARAEKQRKRKRLDNKGLDN